MEGIRRLADLPQRIAARPAAVVAQIVQEFRRPALGQRLPPHRMGKDRPDQRRGVVGGRLDLRRRLQDRIGDREAVAVLAAGLGRRHLLERGQVRRAHIGQPLGQIGQHLLELRLGHRPGLHQPPPQQGLDQQIPHPLLALGLFPRIHLGSLLLSLARSPQDCPDIVRRTFAGQLRTVRDSRDSPAPFLALAGLSTGLALSDRREPSMFLSFSLSMSLSCRTV
ncbi:hypothetical protein BV392_04445 [Rhodovulum sulfidophilum]|nr:hypothetical protein BV392_04445 [Rhodovulum sulfidophilum]